VIVNRRGTDASALEEDAMPRYSRRTGKEGDMTGKMRYAVALMSVAAVVLAGRAGAITPANGGDAGGTLVTINNGSGDQTEPHVSGNLAVYTDNPAGISRTIHYFDFSTVGDMTVPVGALGDNDVLADVNGSRIVFTRTRIADGQSAVMLFNTVSGVVTELDPQPVMIRFGAVIGGNTVAYEELAIGGGDIFAYDLVTGTATNLTQSVESDGVPAVSPAGNAVVWERCVGSNCGIYRSVNTGSGWGSPQLVLDTASNDSLPDTDGTTVVYDSDRPSATGKDIYFQPLTGGTETELQIAGDQQDPSIDSGVIAFESRELSTTDIYVYVIANNTLFRVTNTPAVSESLNDLSVLPNGDIRVVWAADDGLFLDEHNVYGRTFSPPATHHFTAAVQQPINADGSSVFKAGKGVVPVKFSLADNGSPTCTLPAATIALTRVSGAFTGPVNESDFIMPADSDSTFRIDSCQYVYNLSLKSLSAGTYRVEIKIGGQVVGSANFELR
jgi:hypothetical protein